MKMKHVLVIAACLILGYCASGQAKLERQRAKDPRYQYNLGLVYLNNPSSGTTSLDQAIDCFDKALALNPKYYLAWNARGLTMVMKGELGSAVESFKKCLEINPSFSEARNNLGSVYESQGLASLAEVEYKKALAEETYPNKELPYYNLARMAFNLNRYDDALSYIQKSLLVSPRFAMAHNLKGMIFEKTQLLPEALASYEQAARIVPDDMNFQFNLAVAKFNAGSLDEAKEIFSLILNKSTDAELRAKAADYQKRIK
ncbi:MAG: hypothetical protein A2Y56_04200 [Candidatus Aminicenantes bacterium RBG_13_63_10]|nr:MAG: hypothetical protein A2Y56_04200 [Candidatus Aminicenantes bacterium RBG_13_63_10]